MPKYRVKSLCLTTRKHKILDMLLENGCSNQTLASHFGISIETAKRHISNIMDKKGFSTRSEMIANELHRYYRDSKFYGS